MLTADLLEQIYFECFNEQAKWNGVKWLFKSTSEGDEVLYFSDKEIKDSHEGLQDSVWFVVGNPLDWKQALKALLKYIAENE
jgi:hypothetical protein